MNIIETIKTRNSCRTFNQEVLKPSDKAVLEDFIQKNNKSIIGEDINLFVVQKYAEDKKMKLDYGMIQGHNTYILGKSKATQRARVNFGYLMEKVVLKATEMGISSCWVGYFDNDYFQEFPVENGYEIPSIVIIGYSKEKLSIKDKFVRLSVNSSKRLPFDKIFFDYKTSNPISAETAKQYTNSLEMVRLAPSSGNTQPWRIFFDNTINEFHFYKKAVSAKYEAKGLHDIDMGIALAHFELTAVFDGLKGSWINYPKETIDSMDDMKYIITWKCE